MDYIKRADALNFDMSIECEPDEVLAVMEGIARVLDYIKQIPAADVVEVRHGEWKYLPGIEVNGDKYLGKYKCNLCSHYVEAGADKNYCPNCGCRMDGGADNG